MTTELERREASTLCEALYPKLFGALALYTGNRETAEDITQEVLLRMWRDWDTVVRLESPDRWALRVGFNLAKSRWRRRRVERAAAARMQPTDSPEVDGADVLAVRSAVRNLAPRQRAAIVSRYFADLSVTDAAEVLGCAPGTVKALTHQAIANLRASLTMDIDLIDEERELHG